MKHSIFTKTSLALLLTGSLSISGTLAYANSNNDDFETVTINQPTAETVKDNDEALLDATEDTTEELEDAAESPSLLPGDFFYFTKIALEKIKLTFTMNDAKEAKLLAEFAAERLAETEVLMAEGKEDEAISTIQESIEIMQQADNEIAETEKVQEKDTRANEDSSDRMEETIKDSTDEQIKDTENFVVEDHDKEGGAELQEVMSQNIIALTAALEKVKNPKAKAALQKNIEKSYAKLAEKLEKWSDKIEQAENKGPNRLRNEIVNEETSTAKNEIVTKTIKEETILEQEELITAAAKTADSRTSMPIEVPNKEKLAKQVKKFKDERKTDKQNNKIEKFEKKQQKKVAKQEKKAGNKQNKGNNGKRKNKGKKE